MLPGFPLFPLVFCAAAWGIDQAMSPWTIPDPQTQPETYVNHGTVSSRDSFLLCEILTVSPRGGSSQKRYQEQELSQRNLLHETSTRFF